MKFNILDLDDAMLNGQAKLDQMFSEIEKDFMAPIAEMQIAAAWKEMPDEIKLALRKKDKKAVDKLDKKFGGK